MKSKSNNDLDFLSNDLRCRRYLSRKTVLMYQVMFLVACVDESLLPCNTHLSRRRTTKARYF